jgi:hypothetical protein
MDATSFAESRLGPPDWVAHPHITARMTTRTLMNRILFTRTPPSGDEAGLSAR